MTLKYVDLFAGCGGISLGLHKAGLRGLFAVEKNINAFQTLQYNLIDNVKHFDWPEWLPIKNWNIDNLLRGKRSELETLKGKVDLIVGGPPCQGFSLAGQRQFFDKRNKLINSYLRFVEIVQPQAIVFENVYGFTLKFPDSRNYKKRAYSDIVISRLHMLGYTDARGEMVDMHDFGVPQHRRRFIVIATRKNLADKIFEELFDGRSEFLESKKLPKKATAYHALSDLERLHGEDVSPDTKGFMAGFTSKTSTNLQKYLRVPGKSSYIPDSHRFVNHTKEVEKIFAYLLDEAPKNKRIMGEERQDYGIKKRNVTILDSKQPALTLTTIPDDFIHYSEPRVMTVRECARLQTFPDWFEFKGPYTTGGARRKQETPRYTQVGNAVPPLFAEQVGLAIKKILNKSKN